MNYKVNTLDLGDILAKGMIPVVRRRHIVKIRVPSRSQLAGVKNTNIISGITPCGVKVNIHRNDLIDNYTHINGAAISLAGLQSDRDYIVVKKDNTPAFAMLVPVNCTVVVGGKRANAHKRKVGDYIVADQAESGLPDTSAVGIIPAAMFKKMYYMPPNEIISKHRNSKNRLFRPEVEIRSERDTAATELEKAMKAAANAGVLNISERDKRDINKNRQSNIYENNKSTDGYTYIATGRLLNTDNQLVGFVIQHIKTGETRNITTGQMMALCKDRKVSNIKLGKKTDTGKFYLSGNNIRISMLPPYNV